MFLGRGKKPNFKDHSISKRSLLAFFSENPQALKSPSSEPSIEPAQANQKLNSLGWNEVAIDYHSLQIAIACLEADTK